MCAVKIDLLADIPEAIPVLARWFYKEWHAFDGHSIEAVETLLAKNLNRDTLPITFVCLRDHQPAGTVSLDISDLPAFDHLSPWLASLYVVEEARKAGIGSALVRYAQQFAVARGLTPLYLWTPGSARFYERCGWVITEHVYYNSQQISLMRYGS